MAQAMERYLAVLSLQERCEAPPTRVGQVDRPLPGGEDEALVV